MGWGPLGGARGRLPGSEEAASAWFSAALCAVLNRVRLFATSRTVVRQVPLSVGILQARTLKEMKAEAPQMGCSSPEANCDIRRTSWPQYAPA